MAIYGTRPEAIKMAHVVRALQTDARFHAIPVVTGQHREMLDQVNVAFGITPDHDLNLMRPGQQLNRIVSGAIAGIDDVIAEELPDIVLVQGDTSTAMAAAIAAFNREVPVAHLEAGLRTGSIDSPFPEEANRKLISQVASLHLAPTDGAKTNLLHESVDAASIAVTGNTVIDALLLTASRRATPSDPAVAAVLKSSTPIILVTTHRRENIGDGMSAIAKAVAELAIRHPDHTLVLPLHRNPIVRSTVVPTVAGIENVLVTEPLPYAEFTTVLSASRLVLTDSGGVQEEAPSLGKPVLVLRDNTERPEAVEAGTVRLVGTDYERILFETSHLLTDHDAYNAMATAVNPYGDGRAAERSLAAISSLLKIGERIADFKPLSRPR